MRIARRSSPQSSFFALPLIFLVTRRRQESWAFSCAPHLPFPTILSPQLRISSVLNVNKSNNNIIMAAAAAAPISTPQELQKVIGETLSPYANIRKAGESILLLFFLSVCACVCDLLSLEKSQQGIFSLCHEEESCFLIENYSY